MEKYPRRNWTSLIGPALLVLLGVFMVLLSWRRWPDDMIDFGRELFIPWQLLEGKTLYRDISVYYGPFAYYVNALLFTLFGTSLDTVVVANLILICLFTVSLYYLLEAEYSLQIAMTACLVFLSLFAFSQYVGIGNYNFLCPYTYSVTYGFYLSSALLVTFIISIRKALPWLLFLTGFLSGLVYLNRIDLFLPVFLTVLSGILLCRLLGRFRSFTAQAGLYLLGIATPLSVFIILYLVTQQDLRQALENVLFPSGIFTATMATNPFYIHVYGLDQTWKNVLTILQYTLYYALLFAALVGIGMILSRIRHQSLRSALSLVLCLTIGIYGLSVPLSAEQVFQWQRPFPLFIVLLFIGACRILHHHRGESETETRSIPIVLCALFAFLLSLKMILNFHIYHYGFVLALPATIIIACLWTGYIPGLLTRYTGNRLWSTGIVFTLLALYVVKHLIISGVYYAYKTQPLGTGHDRFYTYGRPFTDRGSIIEQALTDIGTIVKPDESLLVIPEGAMLNYLARRKGATPYYEFAPTIIDSLGEAHIIRAFEADTPDFILFVERDNTEHGARYFGKNFALSLSQWILQRYAITRQWGAEPFSGTGFGIQLLKLKEEYTTKPP